MNRIKQHYVKDPENPMQFRVVTRYWVEYRCGFCGSSWQALQMNKIPDPLVLHSKCRFCGRGER